MGQRWVMSVLPSCAVDPIIRVRAAAAPFKAEPFTKGAPVAYFRLNGTVHLGESQVRLLARRAVEVAGAAGRSACRKERA